MRKAIIRKIKSERGASLSMALLLFMVCAVVGGVILAAATASSGRFANMAEMDQRYYAVTSAAELVGKELSETTVTITRTKTDTTTYSADGRATVDSSYGSSVISNPASGGSNIAKSLAEHLMFGDKARNSSEIMDYDFNNPLVVPEANKQNFSVTPLDNLPEGSKLNVVGTCEMSADGIVTVTLRNDTEDTNQYTVVVTLSPTIEDEYSMSEPEEGTGGSFTTEETIKSTIHWEVASIQ